MTESPSLTQLDEYCDTNSNNIRCRICEEVKHTRLCACSNNKLRTACKNDGCYWNAENSTCRASQYSPDCPFVGWPAALDTGLRKRTCEPMARMMGEPALDERPIFVGDTGLPCASDSVYGNQPCDVIVPISNEGNVVTNVPRDMTDIKFVKHNVGGVNVQDGNGCSYDTYDGLYSWDFLLPAKAEAKFEKCPQTDDDCLRCPTDCAKACPTNCAKACPTNCAPSLLWFVIVLAVVSTVAIAGLSWLVWRGHAASARVRVDPSGSPRAPSAA